MMSDFRCLDHFLWSDQSKERHPSSENAEFIDKYIKAGKGNEVVKHLTDLSLCGRTPRQNYLIFALAICAISKDHDTKKQAYEKLNTICRIPTHLFLFVSYCKQESLKRYKSTGWNTAHCTAIIDWYKNRAKDPESFARLLTKYKSKTRMVQRDCMAEQMTDKNTMESRTDMMKKSIKTKKRPGETKTEEKKMITKTKETTEETKNEEHQQKVEKENNTEDKKAEITEEKKPKDKTNICDTKATVMADETKTDETTNKAKTENKGTATGDNSQETRTEQKKTESKMEEINTEDSMTKETNPKEIKTEEKTEKTRTEVTTQELRNEENIEKIKKEEKSEETKTKQNTGKTTQNTKRDKANKIKKGEKTKKTKSKDNLEQTKIDESTQETKQIETTERPDTKKTKTKENENEMKIDAHIKNTLEEKKTIEKTEESLTVKLIESLAEGMKVEKTKTDEIKIEKKEDITKSEEKKIEKTKTVEMRKEKWSHAKLFNLARPKFKDDNNMKVVQTYILSGFEKAKAFARDEGIHSEFISKFLSFIEVAEKAKRCTDKDELVALIKKHKLERQHINTQMMKNPEVCEAIIVNMKVGAVLRNLTVMSSKGLFDENSEVIEKITTIISDKNALTNERVHPINIIITLHMYEKGKKKSRHLIHNLSIQNNRQRA